MFAWYLAGGVPPRTTIEEVEDYRLADEEQVTLDLGMKSIGKLCAANMCWTWLGPLPANTASLDDLWYELDHIVSNSNSFEKALHGVM